MSQKIIIISRNPLTLRIAEKWLMNRRWEVTTLSDIATSITEAQKRQPDFIMIAADHPDRNVVKLPKLLIQVCKANLFSFTEEITRESEVQLRELGLEESVHPPVSGPAIERAIIRIQKKTNSEEVAPRAPVPSKSVAVEQPGVTVIKGPSGGGAVAGNTAIKIVDKGIIKEDLALGKEKPVELTLTEQMLATMPPAEEIFEEIVGIMEPDKKPVRVRPPLKLVKQSGVEQAIVVSGKKPEAESQRVVVKAAPPLKTANGRLQYKQNPDQYPDTDSILVKGTELVVDKILELKGDKSPTGPVEKIELTTNVACLHVQSSQFNGHLIAAMGKDRKIDDSFMAEAKTKLFEFLRANGESVSDVQPMALSIKSVEFEDWAIEQANFLRKGLMGNSEIAIAFFPSAENTSKLKVNPKHPEMVSMNLTDIKDNVVVDFDLFVHLPANDRFVLYTPGGKVFKTEQRDRLKSKGVSQLHCRKDDANAAQNYSTQNELNESIESMKKNKKN